MPRKNKAAVEAKYKKKRGRPAYKRIALGGSYPIRGQGQIGRGGIPYFVTRDPEPREQVVPSKEPTATEKLLEQLVEQRKVESEKHKIVEEQRGQTKGYAQMAGDVLKLAGHAGKVAVMTAGAATVGYGYAKAAQYHFDPDAKTRDAASKKEQEVKQDIAEKKVETKAKAEAAVDILVDIGAAAIHTANDIREGGMYTLYKSLGVPSDDAASMASVDIGRSKVDWKYNPETGKRELIVVPINPQDQVPASKTVKALTGAAVTGSMLYAAQSYTPGLLSAASYFI
jgi:hypothetical protein